MADFPAVIQLSTLDGTDGFQLSGVTANDNSGWSIASLGDINGDGIDDLIIGARGASTGGYYSGACYVVFGTAAGFPAEFQLSALNGANGFRIDGAAAEDLSGWSVASAGDINGDGLADLVIGAVGVDQNGENAGAAYVVFGSDAGFTAELNLSALDGTDGFRINGAAAFDYTGFRLASAGDFNGDGIDDLFIGAHGVDPAGAGYVVFGSDAGFGAEFELSALDGSNGFRISGATAGDYAGWFISSAGDINGDGLADVTMGAFLLSPNGLYSGAAYVVFGTDEALGADLNLADLDGTNGFRIPGLAAGDQLGRALAPAGDVNGDGFDDLLVGVWYADPNGASSGTTYVVFGTDAGFAADFDLSGLDGTNGFRIDGLAAGDRSGLSVASAGDVNGDGIADLLIGAPGASPNGGASGSTYVVFGSDAGFGADIDLAALDGTNGFRIDGEAALDESGLWVSAAGDLNGDGIDDLVVGASSADPNGDRSGATYVIFGRGAAEAPVIETGTAGEDIYTGGALDDTLSGAGADDILTGLGGDDTLDGGDGADALYGGDGADDLTGGAGGDLLDGGAGADAMAGGAGDDTYIVDDVGDVITEVDGEGIDRVRTTVSYTLGANLENLTLEGTGDIDGTGNDLNNVIDGNSGANTLIGAGGNDLIKGAAGDDSLDGGTGVDQLLGGDGADTLEGGADNDRLDGGAGIDLLNGGAGNDILDGGADNDTLNGGTGADQLLGGAGTDTLDGGDGNDSLNGGTGADAMTGGIGDDIFFVDDAGDTTVELAGQGVDQVRASISHTLAANIETLVLQGAADLNGTGNGLANTLNGNSGANILDGAGGNDLIKGGLGADTLIGGTGNDILVGGGGADSFVVRQESISLGGAREVDTVSDFSTLDGDIVDLSAIDAVPGGADDAFLLVEAFDGQAGQMTLTFGGGVTTLRLDVNGDGQADYLMKINGNVTGDSGGWLL